MNDSLRHFLLASAWLIASVGANAGTTVSGGGTVYIPLGSANAVIAVDAATDRITARYAGVANPHGLVITADGEYLVAGSILETPQHEGAPSDAPNGKLYLIHPAHGHVMATIAVPGWSHHQAITPDGRFVISTHPTRDSISVVDLRTRRLVRTIRTGPAPNFTVITRDGTRAYVSNSGNGTISEIDLRSWTVTRSLDGGASPEHLVFARDERTLYVAAAASGQVHAVSVETGKIVGTFDLGKALHGLDLGDDGKTLFASLVQEDALIALDTETGKRRVLALAPAPYHLGVIRGAGKLYVSSSAQPKIWVVDQDTLSVTGTIALPGGEGHQLAIGRK